MPESGIEQRVARLEGRVEGFDGRFTNLEARIDALDGSCEARSGNRRSRCAGVTPKSVPRCGDFADAPARCGPQLASCPRSAASSALWSRCTTTTTGRHISLCVYAGHRAIIDIEAGARLAGRLPPRALALVVEWGEQRRAELLENWERARRLAPLNRVAPLE